MNKRFNNKTLLSIIVLIALFVRLLFVFKINAVLYGPDHAYENSDSISYTGSIINFIKHGIYAFDLLNPESAFSRLPGYSVFWGLFYLITGGTKTYVIVAVAQAIIDSLCIILIYRIMVRLGISSRAALIAAAIYSTYFFILVWVPITGTEVLASDLMIVLLYHLSGIHEKRKVGYYFATGLLIAVCFYVREYLGFMLLVVCGWLFVSWLKKRGSFTNILACGLGFTLLYMAWPIRNYVSYNRLELLKPISAGYKNFTEDYSSFRSWVYAWNMDVEPYQTQILRTEEPVNFPSFVYDGGQKDKIDQLINLSRVQGSGFYYWKYPHYAVGYQFEIDSVNKNKEISAGFKQLKKDFIKEHPGIYYFNVPIQNLTKAFFKSGLNDGRDGGGAKAIFSKMLFGYRTLLILLGIIGLFLMPRSLAKFALASYVVFIYLFICCIVRQVEMRYLLQADVLLIIPAALAINSLLKKLVPDKHINTSIS